ncbi:MAG: hypothetical protein ACM3IG_07495 [Myxococcales bacterium]|nr:hypothetical protein [Sphingomicrobium sp.]
MYSKLPIEWEAGMKPYILGAIVIWFAFGIAGAVLLGQQRVDIPTIAGGPIAFWNGLNAPVN